jgi:hypothetical protein
LDPLFIHIRGALTWDEQLEVLSSVTFSKRVAPYRYGFDKLDVLVRGQDKKASFDTLSSLVEGFLEEAKLVSDSVPQTYQVEAIELLGYRADSKLEPHVDCNAEKLLLFVSFFSFSLRRARLVDYLLAWCHCKVFLQHQWLSETNRRFAQR